MNQTPQRIYGKIAAWLLGGLISFNATLIQAAPQDGWWWNPNEGGRGFFLEVQGPRMFMSGYFYGDDGRATWLVSNDPMPNPAFYQGNLLAFGNGQSLLGDYRAPGAPSVQGTVTLQFTDDTHAVMTWPGGVVPIERYNYRSGITAFQPKNGWWWSPQESGRGFSIELQGNHMFIGAYMYDGNGNPIWYAADALMESPNVFRAPLLQFGNGQTLTGAYRAPTPPAVVGTLTLDFSAANRATVTLSDEKSSAKVSKTNNLEPLYDPLLPSISPGVWNGFVDFKGTFSSGEVAYSYRVTVVLMNWQKRGGGQVQYPAEYGIGNILADIQIEQHTPYCDGLVQAALKNLVGKLTLRADGSYEGKISQAVSLPMILMCKFPDGDHWEQTVPVTYPVDLVMNGTLVDGAMVGEFPPNDIPELTVEGSWSFRSSP